MFVCSIVSVCHDIRRNVRRLPRVSSPTAPRTRPSSTTKASCFPARIQVQGATVVDPCLMIVIHINRMWSSRTLLQKKSIANNENFFDLLILHASYTTQEWQYIHTLTNNSGIDKLKKSLYWLCICPIFGTETNSCLALKAQIFNSSL